ncbi:enoyl-CoA hydratase-related protein [Hydrocarboniphaga sp.]|uniref:enoyl-CoA hydratase-related protein n=1 Tax=Hydrocarboniphaga sp. TaxID=2033016 RepID=UPI003451DDDD
MGYEFIQVERDGPLTLVTLNRPERMNALHAPAHEELGAAFDEFSKDPDQWVAIITGAGDKAFCAGNDLKYQASGGGLGWPSTGFAGLTSRLDLNKPIIAAVNGVCMGGGFEIALACDLVVAAEHASFALPEVRVGLAAVAGGLQRLPRQIGVKPAMGIILTGRTVSAQEGCSLGFVNEVVAATDLLAAARRWANQILSASPMSVRASKEAVSKGLNEPSLEAALQNQLRYPALREMFKSEDFIEGPRAFAQKRRPQWKGQ